MQKITPILSYTLILLVSGCWFLGCNPTVLPASYQAVWLPDSYRYGDLYQMAFLKDFKEKTVPCAKKYAAASAKKSIHLYIIGDSFTDQERIDNDDFVSQKLTRVHWAGKQQIQLDTTKHNVLILETVERHFREKFVDSVRNFEIASQIPKIATHEPKAWYKDIETKLEATLFSSDFFLMFKEWKAALTLHWFGRMHEHVNIAPDGKNLLYISDTNPKALTSSFHPFSDQDLKTLVQGVNKTRQYYLKAGFDEVYLAIIPNKTSIVAPQIANYNHLIERVQQHPQLQVPAVDCWQIFRQANTPVYLKGDTHWNCTGQTLWLEKVNEALCKIPAN
ncbi:MAG: hypothetical protein EAZ70_08680 [Runella slithyformis]|nr:MAG: hypothetical protein EAZ80_11140 [Runella slithyformis]TAF26380.1 MAG: hypothetical protein EAZ70_08680 [Runella slithyformis]TAF45290.1 MAG: hypothetical protein EAZ63_11210 [Runella slithyformis]